MREAIRLEARREFAVANQHDQAPDSTQVDFLVSQGQMRLEDLRKMLSLAR